MSTKKLYEKISSEYQRVGDPEVAIQKVRYMRNQFEFYGLKAKEWVGILKILYKDNGLYHGKEYLKLP